MSKRTANVPAGTNMVDKTVKLIEEGNLRIQLDDRHRNIVLVMGNTGAGKSTLTKMLASIDELECFDNKDRYLIRDKSAKVKSGIVSETIFPELIVDEETNAGYYDLPGFMDTRDESIEIANAWFMKKVASHAKKIKLLLVINHTSLLGGESRTDLPAFLENCASLVKDPRKFSRSIALVATKVRGDIPRDSVIHGICAFLNEAKRSLPTVITDKSQLGAAQCIVEALLTKDSSGELSRIALFREPTELGPLNCNESVREERAQILQILDRNIVYSESSPDNFGLSISPGGRLLILQILNRMNQDISLLMQTSAKILEDDLASNIKSSSYTELGTLFKQQVQFQEEVQVMKKIPSGKRGEFFVKVDKLLSCHDKSTAESRATLQELRKNLDILEEFSGQPTYVSIPDWSTPFQFTVDAFKTALQEKVLMFTRELSTQLNQIAKSLDINFNEKFRALEAEKDKRAKFLQRFNDNLVKFNESLSREKSVNAFFQCVKSHVSDLDPNVGSSNLVPLKDDLNFESIHFNVIMWTREFDSLQSSAREALRLHAIQFASKEEIAKLETKSQMEREAQTKRILEMQASFDKKDKEQKEKWLVEKAAQAKQMKSLTKQHQEGQKQSMAKMEALKVEQQKQVEEIKQKMEQQKLDIENEKKKWIENRPNPTFGSVLGTIVDGLLPLVTPPFIPKP